MKNKLAIFGGRPVLKNPLPPYNSLGKEEERAALKVMKTKVLSAFLGREGQYFLGGHYVKELEKKYHIFGLEAYIHSGVVLALSSECNFSDRQWDVLQLGAVFVARKEWKIKDLPKVEGDDFPDEGDTFKCVCGLLMEFVVLGGDEGSGFQCNSCDSQLWCYLDESKMTDRYDKEAYRWE